MITEPPVNRRGGVGPAPVSVTERVQELDVLRGVALFGILIVNILDYAPAPVSGADRAATTFIELFADGSFFPLFSLLFGIGFVVFLDRAAARGSTGVLLYLRRTVALLLIALLQIVFLEDRNILVRYAFLSLPLLLFWRASARTCLLAAVFCVGLAVARGPLNRAVVQRQMRDPVAAEAMRQRNAAEMAKFQAGIAEEKRVAATRNFIEIATFRARWQVPQQLSWSMDLRRNPSLLHILGMFLLGAAAWRSGVLRDVSRHRRLLQRILVLGLASGITGNVLVSLGPDGDPMTFLDGYPTATTAIRLVSNTALTLSYVAGLVLLMSGTADSWRRRLAPLAIVGRMGLTNYLWQSFMMSLLFLPYGLGLEGALPAWAYPLLGVLIFLTHLPLSSWWLARFRFGPAEWLWRSATYGRFQPMERGVPDRADTT